MGDVIIDCGNVFCVLPHGLSGLCGLYPDDLQNPHHSMCRGGKSHDRYWCDCICHDFGSYLKERYEKRTQEVAQPDVWPPAHMRVYKGNFEGSGRLEPTIYHASLYPNDTCNVEGCPRSNKTPQSTLDTQDEG